MPMTNESFPVPRDQSPSTSTCRREREARRRVILHGTLELDPPFGAAIVTSRRP